MAFLIDQLNNSGLFAQSAYSACIATKDSNGNDITATYLTGVDLTPYQTTADMVNYQTTAGMTGYATTGDVANKLDTTAFSDVSGTFLTAHQSLDGYATTAWVDSQGYLTAHQPISADEWNSSYETVQTNSGSWGGGSIDTIPVVSISPLVTGFSGDSAYMAIESSALNLSSYVPVSALTFANNYLTQISGYTISSYTGRYAMTANYANTAGRAYKDRNNNEITSYYQPKLTIAGVDGTITAINNSAVGADVPSGFELVAGANISIVDDPQNSSTTISADLSNYYTKSETSGATELADAFSNIPAGDAEVNSYVQTNSGAIDETISTYQTNSGTYLTAHQAISANEWNDCYDNVQTNSATWGQGGGGSYTGDAQGALDEVYTNSGNWNDTYTNVSTNSAGWGGDTVGLSAGWGIDIQLSNNAVWISATTQPDLTYLSGSIDYVSGVVGDVESLLAQL